MNAELPPFKREHSSESASTIDHVITLLKYEEAIFTHGTSDVARTAPASLRLRRSIEEDG